MSLATRCSACGTVFRIVQDQLKVSEGWVRCGRCSEVFNALEGLFDLERDSRPESWMPTVPDAGDFGPPEREPTAPAQAQVPATETAFVAGSSDGIDPAVAERFDQHLFGPRRDAAPRRTGKLHERDQLEFADAQLEYDPFANSSSTADVELDELHAGTGAMPLESEQVEAANPPDFVQRADRAARWRSPRMRLLLALVALLLVGALAFQVAQHERDLIAARWPEARPTLDAWCERLGCRIEPLRRIDDISVESTALTRAGAAADVFKLAVTLRNRGELMLAMPSIDLTLTDSGGDLVARRALGPQDFRVAIATLAPGAEAPLQLTLSAGSPRVSGYTVEIFYP